jgi:predicted transcriptional regulator
MQNSHLTLRLPAALARLLARWAAAHGVPKSQVAREAVARYLAGPAAGAAPAPGIAASELARRWSKLPELSPEETDGLAADIAAGRAALPLATPPWE